MVKCLRACEEKVPRRPSSRGCKLFHLFSEKTVKGDGASIGARRKGDNVFTFVVDIPVRAFLFFSTIAISRNQIHLRNVHFVNYRNNGPGRLCSYEIIFRSKIFNGCQMSSDDSGYYLAFMIRLFFLRHEIERIFCWACIAGKQWKAEPAVL